MTRRNPQPFILIIATLLLLMSLPQTLTEKMRGMTIASLNPFLDLFSSVIAKKNSNETEQLKLENQLLRQELERQKEFPQKTYVIPAKVIYRSPTSWNSSLWINIGNQSHPQLLRNSPVLYGTALIGVLDYVGAYQSRVKLITDSGLTPSVRSARGDVQKKLIKDNIDRILAFVKANAFPTEQLQTELGQLKNTMLVKEQTIYIAKGELQGSSKPLWRNQGTVLKGIGFNYDFADEHGPARDLRTGEAINSTLPPLNLLQVNDILVTTGMDGVFPEGIKVAQITKIDLLKEGDYFYTLEAKPIADNLEDLSVVFVIPPLGYDFTDQPPRIGEG